MSIDTLIIPNRFRGPSKSGNGGYVCGRVAAYIQGVASVRLMAPPPLDTELRVEKVESRVQLLDGDRVIAEGKPAPLDLMPPFLPSLAEAEEAAKSFFGFTRHRFPQCFVCGPKRPTGDGMRIFPGMIETKKIAAAPWTPHDSLKDGTGNVGREFLWAALDCTSVPTVFPVPEGMTIVLGELCVRIDDILSPGERCIVIGWPLEIDGRKRFAGSAIFGTGGRTVAVGRATWIVIPVSSFEHV